MTWPLLREQLLALASPAPDRLEVSSLALAAGAVVVGELERLGAPPPSCGVVPTEAAGLWLEWDGPRWAILEIYAEGSWDWTSETQEDDQIDSLRIHLGAAQ